MDREEQDINVGGHQSLRAAQASGFQVSSSSILKLSGEMTEECFGDGLEISASGVRRSVHES